MDLEPKVFSRDYLKIEEKLDTKSIQTQLVAALDSIEKKLLQEKRQNGILTNALEELSEGFLDCCLTR